MPNDIGLNAGVPNLAPWPSSASQADLTALQATVAAIPVTQQLAAAGDLSNNANPAYVTLWTVPVLTGKTYSVRLDLIVETGAAVGGVTVTIERPSSLLQGHSRITTTGATVVAHAAVGDNANSAADKLLNTAVSFATNSFAQGLITCVFQLVAAANGNMIIKFRPATNGQNMTIKGGSTLQVTHN